MSITIPHIIHQIWSDKHNPFPKEFELLSNTWKDRLPDWPLMLSGLYAGLPVDVKDEIYLMPAKHVTPFDSVQIRQVKSGIENDEPEACPDEAYAVHYFTNLWVANH